MGARPKDQPKAQGTNEKKHEAKVTATDQPNPKTNQYSKVKWEWKEGTKPTVAVAVASQPAARLAAS